MRPGVPGDEAAAARLEAWLAAVRGVAAPARALARAAAAAAARAADGGGWGDESGCGGGPEVMERGAPASASSSPDPALDTDVGAVARARAALGSAHRARLAAWVAALPAFHERGEGGDGEEEGVVGAAWEGVAVLAGA